MKRIISLLVALALTMSLGMVVFATDSASGMGDHSIAVEGSYVPGSTTSETLFSVEITWQNMSFAYHDEVAGAWDPENHRYYENTAAYWVGQGTITVANNSNAKIAATTKYDAAEGYGSASMKFSPSKLKLASAENSGQAVTGTITVTPEGTLPKMDNPATIGSITVTISQDTDVTKEEMEELIAQADELYQQVKDNDLEDQLGSSWSDFNQYRRTARTKLESWDTESQETLNTLYDNLLAAYNAVVELM